MKTNFDLTETFSASLDRDFNHPESELWFGYRPGQIKDAEFWRSYYQTHKEQRQAARRKWEAKNPRPEDRHQLTRLSRYRIQVLQEEFAKLGLLTYEPTLEKISQEKLPAGQTRNFVCLEFSLGCMVDKKSSGLLDYLDNNNLGSSRSLFFYWAHMGKRETQEAWLLIRVIQKKQKELRELLVKKPLLFKKRLRELVAQVKKMLQWGTKRNLIPTENKYPLAGCKYGAINYREEKSLAYWLFQNGEVSGKTNYHPTADFDIHKLPPELQPIIRKKVEMLIKHCRCDYYGLSLHGSPHLYFRSLTTLLSRGIFYYGSEVNYQPLRVGDFKAQGGYVVLPISQGRNFVITERGQKKIQARQSQELADSYFSEQHTVRLFNKLGFYFTRQLAQLKKPRFIQSRKQLKPSVSSLIKSDQTERFEVRGVKILWNRVKPVPQLNSVGGSRNSEYYQLSYRDSNEREGKFLWDKGWRENLEPRLNTRQGPLTLVLQKGERTNFLIAC